MAALSAALVCGTAAALVRFVSLGPIYRNITGDSASCTDEVGWTGALWDSAVWRPLLVDAALLLLFVAHHRLQAWAPVRRASGALLGPLSRAAYCASTALVLQVLMKWWQPVHSAPCLWAVREVPWSVWFPVLCFALHVLCWALTFSTLLLWDYTQLLGLKQVYYDLLGRGDPLSLMSPGGRRLFSHLRHPVYLELCVVLWVLPALPLDRLLLAGALTSYLGVAHSLDPHDLAYLCAQVHKKLQLLTSPARSSGGYTMATSGLIE